MADPIYKNSTSIGDGKSDIILNTIGKIIVKVQDRYYTLTYNNNNDTDTKKEVEEEVNSVNVILLQYDNEVNELVQTITNNAVIFTAENTIYLYLDNILYPLNLNANSTFNDITVNSKLIINGSLSIKSLELVKNLNAEYLDGEPSSSYITNKTPQTISQWWTFVQNVFFKKQISNTSGNTVLDFETNSLTIDNIIVKRLTILEDDLENSEESTEDVYINSKIVFGKYAKVNSATEVQKIKESWNENWDNGGKSILSLLMIAITEGFLENYYDVIADEQIDQSYSYYTNLLLEISTSSEFTELITVTETDFSNNTYKNYFYRPNNNLELWSSVKYGDDSNAKLEIYDKWFDKNKYSQQLEIYNGIIWTIELESNSFQLGTEITYINNNININGIVTQSDNNTIVIITNTNNNQYIPQESTTISSLTGLIIGNLINTNNSIFGDLTNYGINSEGNCYFVNPHIALFNNKNYLKLSNKDLSFIGINENNENFISINTDGECSIQRKNMYNINNYLNNCYFGPIIVNKDGSSTIGSGETQITISTSGEITIPSAAIK